MRQPQRTQGTTCLYLILSLTCLVGILVGMFLFPRLPRAVVEVLQPAQTLSPSMAPSQTSLRANLPLGFKATPPVAQAYLSNWPLVLLETFDSNLNAWPVGDYQEPPLAASLFINEGNLRFDVKTGQGINLPLVPRSDPASDFYLAVDARQLPQAGNGTTYGLVFRYTSPQRFYFFSIDDAAGLYALHYINDGRWTTVVDYTPASAIHPGEVNRLAVIAIGPRFEFFINGRFIGAAQHNQLSAGLAGIGVNPVAAKAGYLFDFDNLELRVPPPGWTLPAPTATNLPTLAASPSEIHTAALTFTATSALTVTPSPTLVLLSPTAPPIIEPIPTVKPTKPPKAKDTSAPQNPTPAPPEPTPAPP